MSSIAAGLAAMALGAVLGYALERLPFAPAIQSGVAALLGWVLGSVARGLVWISQVSKTAGVAAVSVGLVEIAISALLVISVAVFAHWALGWATSAGNLRLAVHRPVILGLCGAAIGTALPGLTGAALRE